MENEMTTTEFELIGILRKSVPFGFVIYPYLAVKNDAGYLSVYERLSSLNAGTANGLTDIAIELTEITAQLDPQALVKKFSKKALSPREFYEKAGDKQINRVIRPYTDTLLVRQIELFRQHSIPLFHDGRMPNLYPEDRIPFCEEKVAPQLRFRRTGSGTLYTLKIRVGAQLLDLQHSGNMVLTVSPCYLVSRQGLIKFGDEITGKMLQPFLVKESIDIPKRMENDYFSRFIRKLVSRCEIEAEGFEVRDEDVQPIPVLTLENDWRNQPVLVLAFRYGEKMILADHPRKISTDLKSDDNGFVFVRVKRKTTPEKQWESKLGAYDLVKTGSAFRKEVSGRSFTLYEMVFWLSEHIAGLTGDGFVIEQNLDQQFCLDKGTLTVSLGKANDWYDLSAIVNAGGFSIPFIRFRDHILKGQRGFQLPDGRTFIIPEPWFARYQPLMHHVSAQSEGMQVARHHYRLLVDFSFPEINDIMARESTPEPMKPPELKEVVLRPYQLYGFAWMKRHERSGFGALLADDMGLGKTIQVTGLLVSYYESVVGNTGRPATEPERKPVSAGAQLSIFDTPDEPGTVRLPVTAQAKLPVVNLPCSLVVMPASLIFNWLYEMNRLAPWLKVNVVTSGKHLSRRNFSHNTIVLTTYGMVRNHIGFFEEISYGYVVLDESQGIKNPASKTTMAIFRLRAVHRIAMTGTPVENRLSDLWSQMHFLNPGILGSLQQFNDSYASMLTSDLNHPAGTALLNLIQPFILRRTKEEVAPELPRLTETVSYCTMNDDQTELYEREKARIRNHLLAAEGETFGVNTSVIVLRALMQLRQIANHPLLADAGTSTGSGKFDEVALKLETLVGEGRKVLVFSSFVRHLKLYENWCTEKGVGYTMLTGATTNREKVVKSFREDKRKLVFLISLKAGGTGLNLTEADYVFILDPWWNPAAEMQAVSRAHRIGQDKKVFVYRFISTGTVEEKILILQQQKTRLAQAFVKTQQVFEGLRMEEIMEMFE